MASRAANLLGTLLLHSPVAASAALQDAARERGTLLWAVLRALEQEPEGRGDGANDGPDDASQTQAEMRALVQLLCTANRLSQSCVRKLFPEELLKQSLCVPIGRAHAVQLGFVAPAARSAFRSRLFKSAIDPETAPSRSVWFGGDEGGASWIVTDHNAERLLELASQDHSTPVLNWTSYSRGELRDQVSRELANARQLRQQHGELWKTSFEVVYSHPKKTHPFVGGYYLRELIDSLAEVLVAPGGDGRPPPPPRSLGSVAHSARPVFLTPEQAPHLAYSIVEELAGSEVENGLDELAQGVRRLVCVRALRCVIQWMQEEQLRQLQEAGEAVGSPVSHHDRDCALLASPKS